VAARTGASYVELDDLYWQEGWQPRPTDVFVARVGAALEAERWVVDGQYPAAVEHFAADADCVVWVDPPLRVYWPRLLRRTLRRWVRRERLWGHTRETFWSVVGPRSILWYALRVRPGDRAANAALFRRLEGSGTRLVHFTGGDIRSLADEVCRTGTGG
jgi:hypothetical protein